MGAKGSKETSTPPRAGLGAWAYRTYDNTNNVVHRYRGEAATMVVGKERKQTTMDTDAADLWTNLPPDLVRLIAEKLTNFWDYFRFRCVCNSWLSAPRTTQHINRFLPWVIYPRSTNTTDISFLNVSDGRAHSLHLPEVQGKWIYGSSHGWLVMLDPSSSPPTAVSLLNPLTGVQIVLPSLPEQLMLTSFDLTNALLCSHPFSSHPDHQLLVAVWDYNTNSLAVLNQGDNDWILFNSFGSSTVLYQDIAYFDGALYFIGSGGRLALLDVATSEVRELDEPSPPSDDIVTNYGIYYDLPEYADIYYHLAESAGDLLLFPMYYDEIHDQFPVMTFMFRLDMNGEGERKWVKVPSADGRNWISLFASTNVPAKSSDVPNEYPTYTDYTEPGILYGITTGKIHYLQTWSRQSWLIPSLY